MFHVKIKVRPDETIQFPNVCVHCTQPATEKMTVQKRLERVTRLVDVPLCQACSHQLQRRSATEEKLTQISRLVAIVVGLLALALGLWLSPVELGFGLRLLVGAITAVIFAALILTYFTQAKDKAVLPETRAVREAVGIKTFSWRATTFTFTNETFAERFEKLNQTVLMEI